MKKYIVFAGKIFYPQGAMNDLIGEVDTVEEGQKLFTDTVKDSVDGRWCEIVEHATMKLVTFFGYGPYGQPGWSEQRWRT